MQADALHPEAQAVLDRRESLDIRPLNEYGPEGARELTAELRPDVDGPPVGGVTDRTVPGYDGGPDVPVRVYRPEDEGPVPTVVFFHGGGFVVGDLESHDLLCRHLCREAGVGVVAVDYRLAPEHPFPAAVEDASAATAWVAENPEAVGGDGRVAVAGDSAGGNLAAVVALMARDRDGPAIDYQLLVYPVVSAGDDWPSRTDEATGRIVDEADMAWFDECYFPSDVNRANPYAHPLEAGCHADLPPATVVTAGFDPLRDEGHAYAAALRADGVPVTYRNYDDVFHGFVGMLAEPARLERAHEAVGDAAGDLRAAFE
ncbi:MAG: alpha/beta hydrolase [Halobacteriales archaeon]